MKRLCVMTLALALAAACDEKKDEKPVEPVKEAKTAEAQTRPTATATATAAASVADAPKEAPKDDAVKPADLPAPDDLLAPPADAKKTASGLVTRVLTKGTGKDHPKANERVKVNYAGWTKDKHMFDASAVHGGPATFMAGKLIKGWTEGLQLMVAGEKRRMWIPAALAYGDKPTQPGAPYGDLVFDVELLEVLPELKPPPVPADVKAAPADATKTASGLAYKILKKGTGTTTPSSTSYVQVNYTGWTPDGKQFDTSTTEGEPAAFPLDHVIKGWTEGLQLLHKGDVARLWIPSDLAYGDHPKRPGAPAGPLVFEVELVDFK